MSRSPRTVPPVQPAPDPARSAAAEERRRLACDLHDGLAQELAFVVQQLRHLTSLPGAHSSLTPVLRAAERAQTESRGAIASLMTPAGEPLEKALRKATEIIAGRAGATVGVHAPASMAVTAAQHAMLVRVAREAAINAVRHGRARQIHVILTEQPRLQMQVADDGAGFDPEAASSGDAYGLLMMRDHAARAGCRFEVASQPGQGTLVTVSAA